MTRGSVGWCGNPQGQRNCDVVFVLLGAVLWGVKYVNQTNPAVCEDQSHS